MFIQNYKKLIPKFLESGNLRQGLVGYWDFFGGLQDKSGHNNNGSLAEKARISGDRIGPVLNLDKANGHASIPESSDFDAAALTISLWDYNLNIASSGEYTLVDKTTDSNSTSSWNVEYKYQKLYFTVYAGSTYYYIITNQFSGVPGWHHTVCTYGGQNQEIYRDGVLVVSDTYSGDVNTSSRPILLGAWYNSNYGSYDSHFPGRITKVRIYNRKLSLAEIQQLYHLGAIRFTKVPCLPTTIFLDGKAIVKNKATDNLDGRLGVNTAISNLDGKADLVGVAINSLDSHARIKDSTSSILDGKNKVILHTTNSLDGKTDVKNTTTLLLDGKAEVVYSAVNLLDGKVHPVIECTHVFDAQLALTDRIGDVNASAPLIDTVFYIGGQVISGLPVVDSNIDGVFRYARLVPGLWPCGLQARVGGRLGDSIPSLAFSGKGVNPWVGTISGWLEPFAGIFRIGSSVKSKIDLYGCNIYADSENVSSVFGNIPGVISLSLAESEWVASVLGSIANPTGILFGVSGNIGSVHGRIPYILQVIEAAPGMVVDIVGMASALGAKIMASPSGDTILIADIPGIKWHSSIEEGVTCLILKYVR